MGPYRALISAGFRRYSAYPLATIAGGVTNSVFGLLRASVLTGVIASAGSSVAGYDTRTAISYAWMTQALIAPIHVFSWNDLALRIRTGDIAVDLARPAGLQAQYLLGDLGRAAYQVLPRGLPPLAVGAVTFGLVLPGSVLPYLAGLVSLLMAICISFGCRFLVNLSAFWLLDARGAMTLYVVISNVLSGLFVPVSWFPPWLHAIANATPFPSMIQAPADLLTGRVTGLRPSVQLLGVQVVWMVLALGLAQLALVPATRKLVVQGG